MKSNNKLCVSFYHALTILLLSLANISVNAFTSEPNPFGIVGKYRPSDFYATDVDVDNSGNIYVADVLLQKVSKYSPTGSLVLEILDPEFIWPRTLAVDDSSERIYVLDNVKKNIRVYSSSTGVLVDVWPGFSCAGELDIDLFGRVVVAMNGNQGCANPRYEIVSLDQNGNEVFTFGQIGNGDGDFYHNYGVTVAADGSIVVADEGNQRIQKFNAESVFQFSVGSWGSAPGEFKAPRSPAVDSMGNIFVNDRRNYRIQKFDLNGDYLTEWGSKGNNPGQFFEADGLAIGIDDSLWVAGYHGNDIQHFDNNGTLIERWQGHVSGPGEFFDIKGIGVYEGKLYIVDGNNQRVQVMDSSTGKYISEFGERGQGDATVFNFPRALAVGPDGDLYVSDDDNVRRIKPDGTFVRRYERLSGVRPGSLGLVVSSEGVIFQSDSGNDRINKVDANTGQLLAQWGTRGTLSGQFMSPQGISIGPDDNIYVADIGNSRIQVFDQNGVFIREWSALGGAPRALKIDVVRGIVYVGEWQRVAAYDLDGSILFKWTGESTPYGRFGANIFDIALDQNGSAVYVADRYKGHVLRFVYPLVATGKPLFIPGQDLGLYIWQDNEDGEWHVRFSAKGPERHDYSVSVNSDVLITDVKSYSLEPGEQVVRYPNSLQVAGAVWGSVDGMDFYLDRPGMLSFLVSVDGEVVNIPVYVGASGTNPGDASFDLSDIYGDLRIPQSIWFEEVTIGSGVEYTGESWGGAWGNLNNDIYPDLWVVNHKKCPSLFQSNGDGTFANVAGTVFSFGICAERWHDAHGAAWADFDNDGDQDLIQLVDNGMNNIPDPNELYVNQGGVMTDMALTYGLDYRYGRGRTPLWFDWNNDGLLDLLEPTSRLSGDLPTGLLEQNQFGLFDDVTNAAGLGITQTSNFVLLAEMTGDLRQEVLIDENSRSPSRVLDVSSGLLVDVGDIIGLVSEKTIDAVVADFNGDLKTDIYQVQGDVINEVIQVDSQTIEARLTPPWRKMYGIDFVMTGEITVDLYPKWRWLDVTKVYIGANSEHPVKSLFTLSSSDPSTWGKPIYTPGSDKGLFVWFDQATGKWNLELSNYDSTNLVINGTAEITGLNVSGFDLNELPGSDRLMLWSDTGYYDATLASGITEPSSGRNIGVGDFDNDMDIDIYIVSTGSVANRPNILYENLGDGTFIAKSSFGAEGTSLGRGDAVAVADYDVDGFLDLFVTNGKSKEPFDLDGPSQLFRNAGNENHWIEIDLEGVVSNRDAIGASVYVTAGNVTQLREQNGGMHFRIQNHQRLHFGLGSNEKVDRIEVYWPSGRVQVLEDIKADQLLRVVEKATNSLVPGKPQYIAGEGHGVYFWKETFDGPYYLRATDGRGTSGFDVSLISDEPLGAINMVNLDVVNNLVEHTINSISFVNAGQLSIEAGIDIDLSPSSNTLVSVNNIQKVGVHQLYAGGDAVRLDPIGWMLPVSQLPLMIDQSWKLPEGLSIGKDATGNFLQARVVGDGVAHKFQVDLFFSEPVQSANGVGLEAGDVITWNNHGVSAGGNLFGAGWDGFDISLVDSGLVGIAFQRDALFQQHRAANLDVMGKPNTYRLPRVGPYGMPDYDGNEQGMFLWKDKGGLWHLRVTGGGQASRYVGVIVSDEPFSSIDLVGIETTDFVDISDPFRIQFDLSVFGQWQDGIDFTFSASANVSLELVSPSSGGADLVHVGQGKWPVSELPLQIGGWD